MSGGLVSIALERLANEPGETLRGSYQVTMADASSLEEVEVTVGWHTEGKGRMARGVEHREIHRPGECSLDDYGLGTFSAVLPASPLSYDGVLLSIRWAVRVRALLSGSGQVDAEEVFRLGHVAKVVAPASA
jgi:hypothetical protein